MISYLRGLAAIWKAVDSLSWLIGIFEQIKDHQRRYLWNQLGFPSPL